MLHLSASLSRPSPSPPYTPPAIMATNVIFISLLLASVLSGVQGSMCYVANSYYKECSYGCCGTLPYEECCDNTLGLIVGLVVAGLVAVVVVVVLVCLYVHHKSNQVVRIVESAHSQRNNANITILHMSSDNPYQPAPQQAYVAPMMSHPSALHDPQADPFAVPPSKPPPGPPPPGPAKPPPPTSPAQTRP